MIYFGETVMVCFLETVIRDGPAARLPIAFAELKDWRCAIIEARADLRLVDLRQEGMIRLGVPTDAVRASNQTLGRAWGAAFHEHEEEPDGILYPSRLNGAGNLALFDRAMPSMGLVVADDLFVRPELPGIIDGLELSIA